ncbi:transposase [Streptomyces griseofuscus]|uniref:transposase n=1 Tax=Streptomyces griseofuscus TaxID=146922 RepID=UPI003F512042
MAPLLPPAPERRHRHPGRLRVPGKAALAGILYVLRTSATWRDVPSSGTDSNRRLVCPRSVGWPSEEMPRT